MYEQLPEVIPEKVDRREFTDREKIIQRLYDWAVGIADFRSRSIALITPRRYGKTAVLHRVFNKLFWEQNIVAPFYIEIKEETYTKGEFATEYLSTFARQYIGFYLKNPEIAKNEDLTLEELSKIAKDNNMEYLAKYIQAFLKIPDSEGTNWSRMWHLAQSAPANIAFKTGTRVAVIIDEFQRMDECIYDDKAKTILNKSYTGSYSGLSESKEAPMLVSGSVVSVLKRKVFGGGLRGRVGWMPFGLLSIEDTTLLAFKLSDKNNIPVTIESARLIAEISGGNPFYVWAAFNSLKEDKDLTTAKGVERVYLHEVTSKSGWIREFWEEHFERNMALLNDDPPDKFGLTKKIILYILKNKDREIPFTEIAEKFNISETYAYHKINDLLEMDLVESDAWGIVQGLKDNMLQRCLIAKFKPIIDNIDKIKVQKEIESDLELENQRLKNKIKSLQSQINNLLGKEAELMLRLLMSAFKNQLINGKYFNQDKDVQLTKFDRAPTSIQIGGYQIDLYAKKETSTQKIIWIVESKKWETQVGSANVKEFIEKITVVKNTEKPKALIGWFYSKSGFTNEAIYLLKQNNILYSTQSDVVDLINELKI